MLRSSASLAGLPNSNSASPSWSGRRLERAGLERGGNRRGRRRADDAAARLAAVLRQDARCSPASPPIAAIPGAATCRTRRPSGRRAAAAARLRAGGAAERFRRSCSSPVSSTAPMCSIWRPAIRCCAGWRSRGSGRYCWTGAGPARLERGFTTDRLRGRPAGARDDRGAAGCRRPGGAGGLLHGRHARRGRRRSAGRTWCVASPCSPRPWDFHATEPSGRQAGGGRCALLEPALGFNATLPVDVIQALFALLDPGAWRTSIAPSPACRPTATAPDCSSRWRTG